MLPKLKVLIKGAGEMASSIAYRLHRCHFEVCLTEIDKPLAISRGVTFSEAVYDGEKEIEGVTAKLVKSAEEILEVWAEQKLPVIIDPQARIKVVLHPDILIDAIMAKKNTGTNLTDAELVIGLGPGFRAGEDVHLVVETNNSESLGKVILRGEAEKDTGIPIEIGGLTSERVIHSPRDGVFLANKKIGDHVSAGEVIALIGGQVVKAPIAGVIRALLRSEAEVKVGTKLGEIDPTGNREVCYSIRAKARAIAGGVLEAILIHFNA